METRADRNLGGWPLALAGGLLLAVTLGLWAAHGGGVFMDALAAGWSACFG